jgi:phospholipid/cholesterol/gamma-HCH transport system permease protein
MNRVVYTSIGDRSLAFFTAVDGFVGLIARLVKSIPSIWFYRRQIVEQLYAFSVKTLGATSVIAIFVGLGAMVQGVYQSTALIPRTSVVNAVFKSCVIELCPIVLSLVLAGKLGASLAAEIGCMKITEQVDALETMSLDPVGFLVLPRVIAGLIMLPTMAIFANLLATLSAFIASCVLTSWTSPQEFYEGLTTGFKSFEIMFGCVIKPAIFGMTITSVGSFYGLRTSGGAHGVGEAATRSVVVSAVLIVIFDYYLGKLLL